MKKVCTCKESFVLYKTTTQPSYSGVHTLLVTTCQQLIKMIKNDASQFKGQNRNLLNFNRKVMLITGITPPENLSQSPTKKILYILFLILWHCLLMILYTGQILAIYHFWNNMEVTTFGLIALVGATMTQLEGIYARLHSSSILKLLEFLECNVNSRMEEMDLNENHIQIIEEAKAKARRLNIIMIIFVDVMVACWIIFPITRKYLREHNSEAMNVTTLQYEDRWLDFCFIIWAPFDLTVSPYYEITYVCQIIMFIITTAHWKSVETTIMTLIIYTSAHLKILETFLSEMKTTLSTDSVNALPTHLTNNAGELITQHSVEQLVTTFSNQEFPSRDRLENNGYKNEKQKLKVFIVSFVNYHEVIIEFVQRVNKTFGPVFFISFFVCQLLACLALFQMAVTDIDDNTLINLFVFIAVMTPHFIFCWYGNEVIEHSQLLRQIAFENSLVQQSSEFKHFILMLMKITQKPLRFSALGFYTLSLEEFAKTMNASYAYFNILKNLHGGQ